MVQVADFSRFDSRWNFIAMMPQWEFLDFVAQEAAAYPNFGLVMNAQVRGLLRAGGRARGVSYLQDGEVHEIAARLVLAADGRRSVLRDASGLPLRSLGAPMDVFWFRVPKKRSAENETTGYFTAGRIIALIDRGDYWQCAYVFGKGDAEKVRAAGLDLFRADRRCAAPLISDTVCAITSWDDMKLLSVSLDRLERWHRPGLLVIGDAAYAMSPIGGVGINLAIQDAVAAANIVAAPLARGDSIDPLLPKVQARRMLAVRAVQAFQDAAQRRIISPLLASRTAVTPPLPLRLLDRFSLLRRVPAAFLGFGIRPEHVRSPEA